MKHIRVVVIQTPSMSSIAVSDVVKDTHDIEIIGTAADHSSGMDMIRSLIPDIILVQSGLSIEDFTAGVINEFPEVGIIIMVADYNPVSSKRVVAALASGATDFITIGDNKESIRNLLLSKIRCCSIKRYSHRARQSKNEKSPSRCSTITGRDSVFAGISVPKKQFVAARPRFDAILVGVSTGGPVALMDLLPAFPVSFPVPIIIVLHMPKEFTGPMAAALDRKTNIRIKEAEDGEEPVRGKAYLAPGGYHCLLQSEAFGKKRLHIVDGPAENGCKPSVDVLFRSAAPLLGERMIAVVLTGMGIDGTKGAKMVKQHGGFILVQDEQTSIVWGMPGSIVRAGLADETQPLGSIATRLCELVGM